jgi:hypothetical protein
VHTDIHAYIQTQREGRKRKGYERKREEEERKRKKEGEREQIRNKGGGKRRGEKGTDINALTLSLAQSQQPCGSEDWAGATTGCVLLLCSWRRKESRAIVLEHREDREDR